MGSPLASTHKVLAGHRQRAHELVEQYGKPLAVTMVHAKAMDAHRKQIEGKYTFWYMVYQELQKIQA